MNCLILKEGLKVNSDATSALLRIIRKRSIYGDREFVGLE